MSVADLVTAVLLPLGAGFAVLGAVGMLVFPDIMTRLHAAAKPQTLGLLLMLAGTAVQLPGPADAAPLLLVAVFQLTTAPIVAGMLGRIAHHTGAYRSDRLTLDERQPPPAEDSGRP